jgi:molecular chaperone GrpE
MTKNKSSIFGKKEHKQEVVNEPSTLENSSVTENMSDLEQSSAINAEEDATQQATDAQSPSNKEEELQTQVKDLQDKYIRMMAEFDNFRKRSLKERMELMKSAGEDILVNLLPIMDDFERGLQVMDTSTDVEAVKLGVQLIYNKFRDFLSQRGVKEIAAIKLDFNVDEHEAITKIPAPEEGLKGKVVDVVQKGYYLNDKVIRYSKVVIGE